MVVISGEGMGICLKLLGLRLALTSIMELGVEPMILLLGGYMTLQLGEAIVNCVSG